MSFEGEYNNIKLAVLEDLECLEASIINLFDENNPLKSELLDFLSYKAKRLRPLVGFLFLRALFGEVNPKQRDLLLAVELIHNATLIHDDIIDKADTRRTKETFNCKFDENLAVVTGDFLLSVAMEKIISTGNIEVIKLCTEALKSTCLGEINQYFSKFKVTSINDYIEKSKNKTALLFYVAVYGSLLLADAQISDGVKICAQEFSQNFGIAFQVRDDLLNILDSDGIGSDDLSSGVYTAPVIFAIKEKASLLESENILLEIKSTNAIEKTQDLMDNYFGHAISAVQNFEDGTYKKAIYALVNLLKGCGKSKLCK